MTRFDPHEYRDALSSFATGVTIVTARDEDGNSIGMTASSFNSVSVDPPLILWSVTKTALSANAFKAARRFAVHVLNANQIDLANKFAISGEDKFAGVAHKLDDNAIPILVDFASRFDCKTWAVHEGGDHWIIVGEVTHFERSNSEGLIFSGGSYATSAPVQQANNHASNGAERASGYIDTMLIYHLSRAYHQLSAEFQTIIHQSNITVSQWRVLASLEGEGVQRSLSELSERTFVEPWALVDMLYQMLDDDLCQFEGEDENMIIRGTNKGIKMVSRLFALGSQLEEKALKGITGKQSKDLHTLLQNIVENTKN